MAGERSVVRGRAARQAAVEEDVRQIYLAQFGRLAGWTAHLVGDRDLAHDIATEAFLRLLRDFDSVAEPRPWLYTVCANLVRDHWRKSGRESAAYHRHAAGLVEEVRGPDPATAISVRDAVQELPDRLRVAVLLHYFADLPVATVARELGKSEGTIKRDLFDARHRMATSLEGVR